ncbi:MULTISPECIES: hypothetical protein [Nocardiopsis]|uniref:Uncharacterized protein n=1 Tax=Nocardiopsis metallicus TaxID=179819 RepID=A0A840WIR8_9ACTN|nr:MULTISPECIES: hypothetical protein [Nocardiopsis]MBB5491795.1 hypothetical protein [Nocardiopsis metallicus]
MFHLAPQHSSRALSERAAQRSEHLHAVREARAEARARRRAAREGRRSDTT